MDKINREVLLKRVKSLNLPAGRYVVFGSAWLALAGVKEIKDIDIIVEPKLWQRILRTFPGNEWKVITAQREPIGVRNNKLKIEIWSKWPPFTKKRFQNLFGQAIYVGGAPFVKPEMVVEYKLYYHRLKDKKDINILTREGNNIIWQALMRDAKRGLAVVAHPDDESIWMGGILQRFNDIDWTVISLSRRSDADRMPKFKKVMKFYGAKGKIFDLDDEDRIGFRQSVQEIKAILNQGLSRKKFDVLFTHGQAGEYGHPRHRAAYLAIKRMLRDNKIEADQVFYFSYRFNGRKKVAVPNLQSSDIKLVLTSEEWEIKKMVLSSMYGFSSDSFEVKSCSKEESFNLT